MRPTRIPLSGQPQQGTGTRGTGARGTGVRGGQAQTGTRAPVFGVAKHRVAVALAVPVGPASGVVRRSSPVVVRVAPGWVFVADRRNSPAPAAQESAADRRNSLVRVAQVFAVDSKDSSLVVPVCVGLVRVVRISSLPVARVAFAVARRSRPVCVVPVCVVLVVVGRRGMSGSGRGVRRCVSLCVVRRFRTRRKRNAAKKKHSSGWMRCG